jgi:phosphoserine phosphatase RsbU/P
MMCRFVKRLLSLFVLIVSFALCPECSFAGDQANVQAKVDSAVKSKVEPVVRALAKEFAQSANLDKGIVFAMLTNYLWRNPSIYGAAFAFIPAKKDGKEFKSSPHIYRSGEKLIQKDLIDSFDYTAPEQKWYTVPAKLGKAVWSEPYYNKGAGEAWMTTYSVPVYAGDTERRLIGVVTSDILLPVK